MDYYRIISDSYRGVGKSENEDGYIIIDETEYLLLGVFDGVGSARGAKDCVNHTIKFIQSVSRSYYDSGFFKLSEMMFDCNQSLLESEIYQPYSTCVVVWISKKRNNSIRFLALGDSRLYAVGNQYLSQLNEDDSAPYESNIITRYLGKKDLHFEDFAVVDYSESDSSMLLCTDGIYKQISNLGEFHRVLNLKYMKCIKNGINRLINGINVDDATYILVRWRYV